MWGLALMILIMPSARTSIVSVWHLIFSRFMFLPNSVLRSRMWIIFGSGTSRREWITSTTASTALFVFFTKIWVRTRIFEVSIKQWGGRFRLMRAFIYWNQSTETSWYWVTAFLLKRTIFLYWGLVLFFRYFYWIREIDGCEGSLKDEVSNESVLVLFSSGLSWVLIFSSVISSESTFPLCEWKKFKVLLSWNYV